MGLEGFAGRGGWLLTPEGLYQLAAGDRLAGVEEQVGEDRTAAGCGDAQRSSVVGRCLHRAQQPVAHGFPPTVHLVAARVSAESCADDKRSAKARPHGSV